MKIWYNGYVKWEENCSDCFRKATLHDSEMYVYGKASISNL